MPGEPEPSIFMAENFRYQVAAVNVWHMRSLSLSLTHTHQRTSIHTHSFHIKSYGLVISLINPAAQGDPH